MKRLSCVGWLSLVLASAAVPSAQPAFAGPAAPYFPPPESQGGWRKLDRPEDIRRLAGTDPDRLAELKEWLLQLSL